MMFATVAKILGTVYEYFRVWLFGVFEPTGLSLLSGTSLCLCFQGLLLFKALPSACLVVPFVDILCPSTKVCVVERCGICPFM